MQATLDELNSNLFCKRPILKIGLKKEEPTLVYLIQVNEVVSVEEDVFEVEKGL